MLANLLQSVVWTVFPSFIAAEEASPTPWWTPDHAEALTSIQSETLEEWLSTLASDGFQGRDTPSSGLDAAADFLESKLVEWELEPAGENGSYRQPLDLTGSAWPAEWSGEVFLAETSLPLGPDHCIPLTPHPGEAWQWEDRPLYFVGSLAQIPRTKVADGAVAIAIFTSGLQQTVPSFGQLAFHLSRIGFAGLLLVIPENMRDREQLIAAARDQNAFHLAPRSSRQVSLTPTFLLRDAAWLDALPVEADVMEAADWQSLNAGPLDGAAFAEVPAAEPLQRQAANIVGMIAADPTSETTNETILISAHYDHIGLQLLGPDGDFICNGADDDGSGSIGVLALAQAFAQLPSPPSRNLLFVWFCGEEKGLLGSRHYAEHPLLPLATTVANINLEMIGRPGDIGANRAWVTGFQYSDVQDSLNRGAAVTGLEFFKQERLSDMLFERSDNASFAYHGIPAHSISAGSLHEDYHQPSDEVEKIDFANMQRVVRGLFAGVGFLAEQADRPAWNLEDPKARQLAERRP